MGKLVIWEKMEGTFSKDIIEPNKYESKAGPAPMLGNIQREGDCSPVVGRPWGIEPNSVWTRVRPVISLQ